MDYLDYVKSASIATISGVTVMGTLNFAISPLRNMLPASSGLAMSLLDNFGMLIVGSIVSVTSFYLGEKVSSMLLGASLDANPIASEFVFLAVTIGNADLIKRIHNIAHFLPDMLQSVLRMGSGTFGESTNRDTKQEDKK